MIKSRKKSFKKACSAVLLSSVIAGNTLATVSASSDLVYKDGIFSGQGGGYYSINGNPTHKIKAKVTFKNNEISNVEIVGVKWDQENEVYIWSENPDDEEAVHEYGDNPEYLYNMNAKGGPGALKIVDIIKSKGLDKIDEVIKDLNAKYKRDPKRDKEKLKQYDVVSSCTASSIGIAEAIKEAANVAKVSSASVAENTQAKQIDDISVDKYPEDMPRDSKNKSEVVLRALEGTSTNFDGLSARVRYTDGSSELVDVRDFSKKGLELAEMLEGNSLKKISYGNKFTLDKPGKTVLLTIKDRNSSKNAVFKVNVKSLEYIPKNLEYTSLDGEYRSIELTKEASPAYGDIIFSDLLAPTYTQKINIKSSDLGRNIYLRTNIANHEKTKNEIKTYVLSGPIKIDERASIGNSLRLDSENRGKVGKVRPYAWKLTIANIEDDKNEQIEKLKKVVSELEENKELMDKIIVNQPEEEYKLLKSAYDTAKSNMENIASNKVRIYRENLTKSIEEIKGINKRNYIIKDLKEDLKKLNNTMETESNSEIKLQNIDIAKKIQSLIDKGAEYENSKQKIHDLEEIKNILDNNFKSNEYVKLFDLIDFDSGRYYNNSDNDSKYEADSKLIHDKRVEMANKIKDVKEKYYADDVDFFIIKEGKKVTDLTKDTQNLKGIFNTEQSGYLDEAKTMYALMDLRDTVEHRLNEIKKSSKKIETDTYIAYSEALKFALAESNHKVEPNRIARVNSNSANDDKDNILDRIDSRVSRISGETRYETAIKISQISFKKAKKVYLVSGENLFDSATAASLTKKFDGPILLANDNNIKDIEKEINRLGAESIVLVGGNNSLSIDIERILSNKDNIKNVDRIYGENRYDTALKTAERTLKDFGNKGKVIIVSGKNIADSISVSAFASKEGLPIVFANEKGLDAKTKDFIKKNKLKEALIVGGSASVNKNVDKLFKKSERIAGENRYETSSLLLEKLYKDNDKIIVSNGENLYDALSGSYFAAMNNSPLLLVEKDSINKKSKSIISRTKEVVVLGGENSVNSNIKDIK